MKLSDQQIKEVLAAYGIEASQTQHIGPVVKLAAGNQEYALKQYSSPDGLAFQVAAVEHLHARKFLHCQSFVSAKNRQTIVEFGGKWYLLSKWIAGRAPDVKSWNEMRAMVQQLAMFHQAAVGLEPDQQNVTKEEVLAKTNWHYLPVQLEEKLKQLQSWGDAYAHPAVDKAVMLAGKSMEKLHSSPFPELAEQEQAAKSFVHGDYNFPNVVLRNDQTIVLIDMDNASYHVRMADLMHVVQRNWGVNVDLARRMIQSYHQIRPLGKAEFAVLTAAVSFPAQFWRMIHLARYKGKHPSAKQLDQWGRLYLSTRAAHAIRHMQKQHVI